MFICDFTPCISDRVLHCVIGLSIQGFTRCNMTVYTQYARDKHGKVVVHVQLMKYTKNWTKNQNTWWVVYLITTLNICRFRRKSEQPRIEIRIELGQSHSSCVFEHSQKKQSFSVVQETKLKVPLHWSPCALDAIGVSPRQRAYEVSQEHTHTHSTMFR